MSAIIRSRGLSSLISKNNRLLCSNASSPPSKSLPSSASAAAADQSPSSQPIISAADLVDGQNPPPLPPPPPPPAVKKSWNLLKFTVIGALTGCVATAGYASYGSFLMFHYWLICFRLFREKRARWSFLGFFLFILYLACFLVDWRVKSNRQWNFF